MMPPASHKRSFDAIESADEHWTRLKEAVLATMSSCVERSDETGFPPSVCDTIRSDFGCDVLRQNIKQVRALATALRYDDLRALLFRIIHAELVARHYTDDTLFKVVEFVAACDVDVRRQYMLSTEYSNNAYDKFISRKRQKKVVGDIWLQISRQELNRATLLCATKTIAMRLPQMPTPLLFTDFFTHTLSSYAEKDVEVAFWALHGMVQLVRDYNSEYSQLYETAYAMLQPHVTHMRDLRKEFFRLYNVILSSTLLADYVVCAFVKRLARCTLYAPTDYITPLLQLIRALLIRYPSAQTLFNKKPTDEGSCGDSFICDDNNPLTCGAQQSSLWELHALAKHFYTPVAKQAISLMNEPLGTIEPAIRWHGDTLGQFSELDEELQVDIEKSDVLL